MPAYVKLSDLVYVAYSILFESSYGEIYDEKSATFLLNKVVCEQLSA